MKQAIIKTGKGDFLIQEVPERSFNFTLRQNAEESDLWYDEQSNTGILISWWKSLPFGKYEIIGIANELSEEECGNIADKVQLKDNVKYQGTCFKWNSPKDAVKSILFNNGFNPETEKILIMQKVK